MKFQIHNVPIEKKVGKSKIIDRELEKVSKKLGQIFLKFEKKHVLNVQTEQSIYRWKGIEMKFNCLSFQISVTSANQKKKFAKFKK